MHSKKWTIKTFSIRLSKIVGWTILSIVFLLFALILVVQIPSVQKAIVSKAIAIAEKELGTHVSVEEITLGFPKRILVKELSIEDQSHDTLLYINSLDIATDLWALLHHTIQLNKVSINGLHSHVNRTEKDSSYNFDFIIKKFTDTTTTAKDTSSKPWKFNLGTVNLRDVIFEYNDRYAGYKSNLILGVMDIDLDKFDLDKNIYHANKISLRSVDASNLHTSTPPHNSTNSNTSTLQHSNTFPDLSFKAIDLQQIKLSYVDEVSGEVLSAKIGTAELKADQIDLKNYVIDLDKIQLNNSFLSYEQMKTGNFTSVKPKTAVAPQNDSSNIFPWHLKLNELLLSGNTIQYYDYNQRAQPGSWDMSHLWLHQISGSGKNIVIQNNHYEGVLQEFTFIEKNGFKLKECNGVIKLTDKLIAINNFEIQTNKSHFGISGTAKYSSMNDLSNRWSKVPFDLKIQPSLVALQEILYFNPALITQLPLKFPKTMSIGFSGIASGSIDDLSFTRVTVHGLQNTSLLASGSIKNLLNFQHAQMRVTVDTFLTSRIDLLSILPDSLQPKSLQIPEILNLKGSFEGSLRAPTVNAVLKSSDGDLAIKGKMDLDSAHIGSYRGEVDLTHFALGKFLKNDSIGTLSLHAQVNGAGLVIKDLNTKLKLTISEFQYNRYNYQNFKVDGIIQNNLFSGKAIIKDKNLDFELDASLDYRKDVPSYKLKAVLKNANLGALHLTFRPIKARGTLDIKLATANFKIINGTIAIRKVAIFNEEKLYKVDSLLFASIDTKGQTDIKINSDIIDGSFQGTIHLLSLPDVLMRHFNSYFSLRDTVHAGVVDNQNFKFSLNIKKTDLITGILFPSLQSFQTSPITGSFNSALRQLAIHAEVKKLRYDALKVNDFKLDVNSTRKSLDYVLDVDDFRYDSLKIPGMKFEGKVAQDSLKSKLTILDSLHKQKYLIGTVFNSLKTDFQFRFIPGQVFLNYNEWKVPNDNYLRFHHQSIQAHNFSIAHDNEKILIDSKQDQDATVTLGFRQFDLENIFNIISGSKSIVAGKLDGDINVFIKKNNAFKALVKIIDLNIMQRAWGDLSLTADQINDDKFDMTLSVKGEHDDIMLKGSYVTTKPASLVDVTADFNRVDMQLLEPFSIGQIKKANGAISGKLIMTGTLSRPIIKGDVNFKDVTFLSSYVNSTFTLKDETLAFDGTTLMLKNFKILDDNNNAAVLKGSIQTKNFRDYILDLNMTTKNFRILNTTAVNNSLYYGKVKMNATATVTGPLSLPVVDLKMGFSDDTEFNYIVPVTSKGVTAQKGIVEFVDKHAPKDTFLTSIHLQDTTQNFVKGFELTATLQLDDAQKFNIIIDPKSGDKLKVQGSTTLIIKIDPSGNMDLSGQYVISKGSYSFSFYKLVRRDFELLKGGTITWSGDPFDATFDLQALYKLETSPLELLTNQATVTDLNPYRQAFPFLVYLNIKGGISTPEISFKIDMPEGSKSVLGGNVYAAIQDINTREPDLNKQVFSLLVLRRFMADDPFENQVTTSLSSNAKSSVSGILTEQLNRMSQNIKGVQLTVDLKSFDDYTTGVPLNQTQLQLGVQKTMLHNKLVVKLAGNVDIAGENTNQNSLTDYIGDLALEYKVNPDGTLRLTGFRNSDYDMIDGELIKTGAGVIYVKDFNAFKELFKANSKDP